MRGSFVAAVFAAVACLGAARSACAQPVISVEGSCPQRLTFRWEGASPDRRAWLVMSPENRGFQTPDGFPCGGTFLDIGPGSLRLVASFRTGASGRGQASGRVAPSMCGQYLQMVVEQGLPCEKSNVVQIPQ